MEFPNNISYVPSLYLVLDCELISLSAIEMLFSRVFGT